MRTGRAILLATLAFVLLIFVSYCYVVGRYSKKFVCKVEFASNLHKQQEIFAPMPDFRYKYMYVSFPSKIAAEYPPLEFKEALVAEGISLGSDDVICTFEVLKSGKAVYSHDVLVREMSAVGCEAAIGQAEYQMPFYLDEKEKEADSSQIHMIIRNDLPPGTSLWVWGFCDLDHARRYGAHH